MHTGLSSGGPGSLLWSWPASFLLTHICKDVVCGLAAYPSTFYNFAPLNLFIFLRLSYSFFWPRPQYVKVPGPGIEHTPQQWQHLIPNPLHHQGTPKPSHCCLSLCSALGSITLMPLCVFQLWRHAVLHPDSFCGADGPRNSVLGYIFSGIH